MTRTRTRIAVVAVAVAAAALLIVAGVGILSILGRDAPSTSASAAPTPSAFAPTPTAAATPTPAPGADAAVSIAALPDAAWIADTAARSGIPARALAAYAGAALAVAQTHPACGLGWNTLAGIGHVESEHGTIGGSALDADGVATPGIVGIALDGTASARIADTDGGALDGDDVWDRAVGPMQFIPTTWALYGRDGSGDGIADVQQIDDAALSAAVYLCEVGGDLTDARRWIAAIGAYNADTRYNNRVAEAAAHYATLG